MNYRMKLLIVINKIPKKIIFFVGRILLIFRYILELKILLDVIIFARLMPFRLSSWFFGNLFKMIGPITPFSSRIKNNLRLVYPLMEEKFVHSLTKQIWMHTGRMIGEMPHLFCRKYKKFSKKIDIINAEILTKYHNQNKPTILMLSHMGNWWLIGKYVKKCGISSNAIYRRPNNPLIKFMWKISNAKMIEKSSLNMRDIIRISKTNELLSILQDHRDRDGIALPFLGINASTATFLAKFAIKYKIPIIYGHCVRDKFKPSKFIMKFDEFFDPEVSPSIGIEELTKAANRKMSKEIEENREQWFWLHKRWKI